MVERGLLGNVLYRVLERKVLAGIIVETEAYYEGSDPASSLQNSGDIAMVLYGDVGRALIYGVQYCCAYA